MSIQDCSLAQTSGEKLTATFPNKTYIDTYKHPGFFNLFTDFLFDNYNQQCIFGLEVQTIVQYTPAQYSSFFLATIFLP